jgi:DNA-binding LacI/PurR family transcriptional regulator
MPPPAENQTITVMENAKAYRAIKSRLLSMIGSIWPAGTKIPPIKILAAQIGAGQTNTHKAVKELVNEGLLASRPGQGTYVLDAMANIQRSPAGSNPDRSQSAKQLTGITIGIVTRKRNLDGFLQTVVDSAQEVFESAGCAIVRSDHDNNNLDVVTAQPGVAGHLLLNLNEHSPIRVPRHHPIVCLSTTASLQILSAVGYDVVMADSRQGGFLVGEHLRNLGCQSACFVGVMSQPNGYDHTSSLRLQGFIEGFEQPLPPHHLLNAGNYATTAGATAVRPYLQLSPRPTAVFCASDDIAIGFVHGALAHGILPGKDYLIVGFDGQARSQQLSTGALTTAAIPAELMGRSAANFLLTRMAYPDLPVRRLQLGCSLLPGTSAISL